MDQNYRILNGSLASLFFCSLSLSTAAQHVPRFHWTLDESSGSVAQPVTGNSSGILAGGALWDPTGGHHNGACYFDGVDDRIIFGPCDILTGSGRFSVSAWVKPEEVTTAERTIAAKTIGQDQDDHIWSLTIVNATAIRFLLRTGPATSELVTPSSSIFSGAWYHVVGSYDGTTMRIYVNGSLLVQSGASGIMGYHPQAPASIAALSTGEAPLSGWVDDVRLYDVELDQQDVIDILLEDEVIATSMEERLRMLPDGRFVLPSGEARPMSLLDATGRLVRHIPPNEAGTGIDLSGITPGLYLICLEEQDQRATWPIVVR